MPGALFSREPLGEKLRQKETTVEYVKRFEGNCSNERARKCEGEDDAIIFEEK